MALNIQKLKLRPITIGHVKKGGTQYETKFNVYSDVT